MDFLEVVRILHSLTRWLVLLVGVITALYLLMGWLNKQEWKKLGQTLLTVFSSLFGLQWLIGLALFGSLGAQTGYGIRHYWEHLTVMTIALAVAHLHMRWKRQDLPAATRYRNGFLLIVVVTLLIVAGIFVLPDAIQWRFYTGTA